MGGLFGESETTRQPTAPEEEKYEAGFREMLSGMAAGSPVSEWQKRFQQDSALREQMVGSLGNQNPQWALDNLRTLASGQLPEAYQSNMNQAVQSGANQAMGEAINNLARRGVLNSSVSNRAFNQIGENVSNALAQGYNQSMATAGQIASAPLDQYNQMLKNVNNFASAREAWEYPYGLYELWRTTRLGGPPDQYVTEQKPGLLDFASPVSTLMGK
jgi:spore germination protein YaaH